MRVYTVWMVAVGLLVTGGSRPAAAQAIGTFSWQLAPFCNVVTVNVTQNGAIYTLDGFDNQCGGANPRAPVVGSLTFNPNGSLGIGLAIVTAPSGVPVHVAATMFLSTLGGTWRDSAGNDGAFIFNGNGAGTPRPVPIPVGGGDVTGVTAGTGLSGGGTGGDVTLAVDTTVIQARVAASCTAGEAVRTVNADGSVVCQAVGAGDITGVTAGAGLTGGATAGDAVLSVQAGGVTTAMLATAAVDATKLASGAVTSAKIAADAVTSTHLANGAINDTAQIATGAITVSDLATAASSLGASARTIPALACSLFQTTLSNPVPRGSLMWALPSNSNPAMPGLTSVPMIALNDGAFVWQVCNSTAADVTTGFSLFLRLTSP
jgi:hypothetical protein